MTPRGARRWAALVAAGASALLPSACSEPSSSSPGLDGGQGDSLAAKDVAPDEPDATTDGTTEPDGPRDATAVTPDAPPGVEPADAARAGEPAVEPRPDAVTADRADLAGSDAATDGSSDAAAEGGGETGASDAPGDPPQRDGDRDSDSDSADASPPPADARPLEPVTVVADTLLSANATATKSYDTNVNIASYRQHGLLYYQGHQYASWYNGNTRNAIVARRTFDAATFVAGEWAWAYVDFILASGADSHNVMSMGVSREDGRLHVAIGQHDAQLYSIRTVTGALAAATWDNGAFGGTGTSASGAAKPTSGLPGYSGPTGDATYPYFVTAPDGTLQFAYRTGSSGDGELRLAEYAPASGTWSAIGQLTSATGSYTQNGITSSSRNAYPHGLDYDGAGRLHMTFTFRENLGITWFSSCSGTISNHDTLYLYSDDRGRTFKNNAGATAADTRAGTTAGIGSPGLVIDPLPVGRDLMNQETQVTDHRDVIHAVISYVPERYQTACANDRTQAQPHHLWRDATGKWTKTEIKLAGKDVNQGYDRSKAFVDAGDNLYVLLPDLRLLGATAASRWTDWQLLWDGRDRGNYGEAIIDYHLTRAASGVSILYLKNPSGSTGELRVLDLKLGS